MSMNNQAGVIHPRVISLSNKMDSIYNLLINRQFRPAVRCMYIVMMELKPGDKDKELFENLRIETIELDQQHRYRTKRERQIRLMTEKYWEWYEQLNTLLHTKGYFSGNAYRPFTPSEDMPQQNPKPVKRSYDERLRSDLE